MANSDSINNNNYYQLMYSTGTQSTDASWSSCTPDKKSKNTAIFDRFASVYLNVCCVGCQHLGYLYYYTVYYIYYKHKQVILILYMHVSIF